MANPGYVDSAAAGTGTGASWANANTTLTLAIVDQSAGDTIYVSDTHAESTASAVTLTFPGTLASPNNVICANDAAEPPTAVATTGTVTTTNNSAINTAGSALFYGLEFVSGSGATGGANINLATGDGNSQTFESCSFRVATTSTAARLNFGPTTGAGTQEGAILLKNCIARFGSVSQGVSMFNRRVRWDGGGLATSTSAITTFVATAPSSGVDAVFSGLDLSYGDAGMNLVATAALAYGKIVFRNCKLPGSWSGSLLAGAPTQACFRAEMHNCDSGDTNYRMWVEDYAGSIRSETTIVRTGGASDGTTGLSWKMASSANAEYPLITLDSPEIVRWNDTTGSAITVTVEVVTDNVTLTNAECWVEVQYLGTSGFPLGSFVSDAKADFLATAANQTSSSETWTTTGLGTPVKQKLSVTFTPQEKGYIHAVVKLAKASTTVYVCPKLDVT
jgi:hypothetical protein